METTSEPMCQGDLQDRWEGRGLPRMGTASTPSAHLSWAQPHPLELYLDL